MAYNPAGSGTNYLGSSISSTQTSILLSSFKEPVTGVPYTMVLLNTDVAYGTIAPKTANAEFISFTGITQNSDGSALLTGVTRGLARKYPFTTDNAYKLPHPGQSIFILSDMPQVFQEYISLRNDITITGTKTFTAPDYPRMDSVTPAPTDPEQLVTKDYVDNLVISGSPDASTTVKGISKLSFAPVSPTDPIAVGDNDPRVPTQNENNALVGVSGSPSTTNKYETENDTSNAATITGTTISFVLTGSHILDSGNGFITANFRAGDSIIVTGSASNDGTYTLVSVAAGDIVVAEALVNEAAGASVTITTVTANKLVRYTSTSNIIVPTTPGGPNTATSQSYVDSEIAARTPEFILAAPSVTITSVAIPDSTQTKIAEWTGLTGNADDMYEIVFEVSPDTNQFDAGQISLRLNNDSGAAQYASTIGATFASNTATQMDLFANVGTVDINLFTGRVTIKATRTIAGVQRATWSNTSGMNAGAFSTCVETRSGIWADTTNQITSIQIFLIQTSGAPRAASGKASLYKISR